MELFRLEFDLRRGENESDTESHVTSAGDVFRFLKLYVTPAVVALGVVTNALTVLTYRSTKLTHFSPSTYLKALAISDSVFLLTLLFVWLSIYDVRFMFSDWWCLLTTYFTEMTTFISLWCITALTVDRYLATCQPWILLKFRLTDVRLCSVFVVVVIVVAGVVIYVNMSLMMGVVWINHYPLCLRLPHFINTKQVLSNLDITFNFALPYVTLIFASICNFRQYRRTCADEKRTCRLDSSASTSQALVALDMTSHQTGACAERTFDTRSQAQSDHKTEVELTKVSTVVAAGFLSFNLPCHAYRIGMMVAQRIQGEAASAFPPSVWHWQQLLLYVFFARSAINLILATASSHLFRRALVTVLRRRTRDHHVVPAMEMGVTGTASAPEAI